MKIDIERCRTAMKNIYMEGRPDIGHASFPEESRKAKIEKAISFIQKNGKTALQHQYLGVKNYAGFGDQGCDCEYGYGPRHGHIVFSIGRTPEARYNNVELGADEIYFLECCRDFGSVLLKDGQEEKYCNLDEVLRRYFSVKAKMEELYGILSNAEVETHC